MKKTLFFSALSILIVIVASTNVNADEEKTNIVCTTSILADFTSNLITENVSVEYIMPSGVCPAFYDTTPSDVNTIVTADIIITFGNSKLEHWLDNLLIYNSDAVIIECKNLGEWNIPSGAINHINCLSEQLSNVLPEKNQTIKQNAQNYILQINETAEELSSLISANGFENRKIICMDWQEDFLNWIGLDVIHAYGPPQGLSVNDELEIINAATENEVSVIVDNLQSGTVFGSKVASETGSSHVIFTNFPGAVPNTDTYLEMINYNTEQLIKGIQTYDYKKGDISNLEQNIKDIEQQRNAAFVLVAIFVLISIVLFIMYKRK